VSGSKPTAKMAKLLLIHIAFAILKSGLPFDPHFAVA
jgi:hypothetical protein